MKTYVDPKHCLEYGMTYQWDAHFGVSKKFEYLGEFEKEFEIL